MKLKKNISALLLALLLILSLAACTGNTAEPAATTQPESANAQSQNEETSHNTAEKPAEPDDDKVLVAYFSATGTTKGVAEKIAKITNADLYEIQPAREYTDADLDWNDRSSRTTKEQNDKSVRPEIASEKLSLDGYSTIYIGYPIWWGEEPRIMDTFVESYDLNGITMIPFAPRAAAGSAEAARISKKTQPAATGLTALALAAVFRKMSFSRGSIRLRKSGE